MERDRDVQKVEVKALSVLKIKPTDSGSVFLQASKERSVNRPRSVEDLCVTGAGLYLCL